MRHEPTFTVPMLLRTVLLALLCGQLLPSLPAAGQTPVYDETLLPLARTAAAMIPGAPPLEVRYIVFNSFQIPAAALVESTSQDRILGINAAYQIRFADGSMMIDAGMPRDMFSARESFSDAAYDSLQCALRAARLIVVTHEHEDHIAGLLRFPFTDSLQRKAILTRAQVLTLVRNPGRPEIRIDSTRAARLLQVDYDRVLPVAPGVALLKAPGHTPGSQIVFIRLADEREVVLAGDVAWLMEGVDRERQKPPATSRDLGEDRTMIARQLAWLHSLRARNVTVLPAHDGAALDHAEASGVTHRGLIIPSCQ